MLKHNREIYQINGIDTMSNERVIFQLPKNIILKIQDEINIRKEKQKTLKYKIIAFIYKLLKIENDSVMTISSNNKTYKLEITN